MFVGGPWLLGTGTPEYRSSWMKVQFSVLLHPSGLNSLMITYGNIYKEQSWISQPWGQRYGHSWRSAKAAFRFHQCYPSAGFHSERRVVSEGAMGWASGYSSPKPQELPCFSSNTQAILTLYRASAAVLFATWCISLDWAWNLWVDKWGWGRFAWIRF